MKLSIFGLLYLALAQRDCGTFSNPLQNAASRLMLTDPTLQRFTTPFKNAIIEVRFHSILNSKGEGKISQNTLWKQIQIMNKAFKEANIQFELFDFDETVSDRWFGLDFSSYELHIEMKTALRKGGYDHLNIYSTKLSNLGYSTFPIDVGTDTLFDGVVVDWTTLPGGSHTDYNLGANIVHETGHWVGLHHIFKGLACSGDGDYVDDTPMQKAHTVGCPKKRPDTCPNSAGLDMIENYMDYSPDACINTFTKGQFERMTAMLRLYRGVVDSDRVLNPTVGLKIDMLSSAISIRGHLIGSSLFALFLSYF